MSSPFRTIPNSFLSAFGKVRVIIQHSFKLLGNNLLTISAVGKSVERALKREVTRIYIIGEGQYSDFSHLLMESRRIQISHNKSQLGKSLHCSVSSNPPRNLLSVLIAFLSGLVVRDLLHWRINALTSSLPQLAQGRPREMATRPGHFCLSESNFLGSKWLFKPSYLKEYHAPQGQISGKITQLHGINYDKTFSPVGKPVTI